MWFVLLWSHDSLMGDPRPTLGMREGFLGKVISVLSQQMSKRYSWRKTRQRGLWGKSCQTLAERGTWYTRVHPGWLGGVEMRACCEISAGGWSQKTQGPVDPERIFLCYPIGSEKLLWVLGKRCDKIGIF